MNWFLVAVILGQILASKKEAYNRFTLVANFVPIGITSVGFIISCFSDLIGLCVFIAGLFIWLIIFFRTMADTHKTDEEWKTIEEEERIENKFE